MAYMLQFRYSAIHRIFVTWVVFESNILKSAWNLKPDDGFLPNNMPELFKNIGHGLTDIVWDEFKPVLYFWE